MFMLLILAFLSPRLCGETSGLFMLGRSFLQLPTGSHSRAQRCHTGVPGVSVCPLPKCTEVQLFRDTSSTGGSSLFLYFSSHSGKSRCWPSVVSASPYLCLFSPHHSAHKTFFFFFVLLETFLPLSMDSLYFTLLPLNPHQNYKRHVIQTSQSDFPIALNLENVLGVNTTLKKGQRPSFSNINTDFLSKKVFLSV